ncbi:hypothetical protein MRB53_020006 [Persea americana]|uniref:Uncharacterized protein n=1 Tax=Persea americana TaxID=3435 RepID=A0ACC2L0X6_PERAE|nr:hypothetical protein MRB53_020006 [Persea americana]
MIGCKVFAQVICEVKYGPSIYEADPTVLVTDIKVAERAKALQKPQSLPLLLNQKKRKDVRIISFNPDAWLQLRLLCADLLRRISSSSSPPSPPIVLDASAPPQICSIFSSLPSAPSRPRSSPPQILSNECRKGASF